MAPFKMKCWKDTFIIMKTTFGGEIFSASTAAGCFLTQPQSHPTENWSARCAVRTCANKNTQPPMSHGPTTWYPAHRTPLLFFQPSQHHFTWKFPSFLLRGPFLDAQKSGDKLLVLWKFEVTYESSFLIHHEIEMLSSGFSLFHDLDMHQVA